MTISIQSHPQLIDSQDVTKRPSLSWKVYPSDAIEEALGCWRRLEVRLHSQAVTCSATWTECWLTHYGDLVPWTIHVAEAGGIVRGICLVTEGVQQKVGPVTIRTAHLGTAGEPQLGSVCVEDNRLLIEEAYRDLFQSELVSRLNNDRRWEQLRLDGFSDEDAADWQQAYPDADIRTRDSRYFDLQSARDKNSDVISKLGKSTRANLRRRLRQYGELETEWAEGIEQAGEIFSELIDLHQARWQVVGQPGAFAQTRFLNFQREVALRLFLEQRAVLFRVRHQQETVGCLFLLVDRNRLLDYLSGFADFQQKPSPGLISHYLCMEDALRRGYGAYDFLVGDKRHKDNLSTDVRQLCWLTVSRPGMRLQLLQSLQLCKRKLRSLASKRS